MMFDVHASGRTDTRCRYCGENLIHTFVDLGMSPLCQTQIQPEKLNREEVFYPLHVYVCDSCYLVQHNELVMPTEIFSSTYPYFSSYSDSWVVHSRQYCDSMVEQLELGPGSNVMEIASNDGYLLQHFVERNIPVLGIEPAANVAEVAKSKGIMTDHCFFGEKEAIRIASQYGQPDLLIGNNVLAHVPDIVDFVKGMKALLKGDGVITMEFPHLMNLIAKNQFDTIYHEHFSYLSVGTVQDIFRSAGLRIYRATELATHGGSIRIFACHDDFDEYKNDVSVSAILVKESEFGLRDIRTYQHFSRQVEKAKRDILSFLIQQKNDGKVVVGYGAPGKGNTLLNYCGIRSDLIEYTVDRSPSKFGTYTPGTRIPILHPNTIRQTKPDFLFVLPWNLIDEVMVQTAYIRDWGGRWVIPIPEITTIA